MKPESPPTISVIIPTWNRAGMLRRAIDSALAQTVPPLEILVCDDGSEDGSEAIVAGYGDPIVQWLPGARGGRPAIPRNRGLQRVKGDWIAFLDSDDAWLPEKLEQQLTVAREHKVLACCTNAYRRRPNGDSDELMGQHDAARFRFDDLMKRNFVICSSVILHRSTIAAAGGFPEAAALRIGEDYAFWLRVATTTDFYYLGTPLVNYLDDAENSVRAHSLDGWSLRIEVLTNLLDWSRGQAVNAKRTTTIRAEIILARCRRALAPAVRLLRRCGAEVKTSDARGYHGNG